MSLAARISALVVSATIVVALVAGLLTLQVLRQTVEAQARIQLDQQLALATVGDDLDAAALHLDRWVALTGDLVAVIASDGSVQGSAAEYLSPELHARLAAGEEVSDTLLRWRAPVILEGTPVGDGAVVLARSDTVLNEASRALVLRVLPALLAGVIVAVVGGAVLARRITRSLVATAQAASRLAAGERGVAVPRPAIPEVRKVAEGLAVLDEALAASEGRQREFLLSISHELRTPLTALRGNAEALADGVIPAEEVREVGATLLHETDRLGLFVNDLLELARMEADDFAVAPAPVDLVALLHAAERGWHAAALRLEIALSVETPPGAAIVVSSDERRLRQLVDGLVENALRVTPAGGSVTLMLEAGDGRARLGVRDTGPGLDPTDLDRAFERGMLRERYRESRPVGSGLGLSIAARLARRLGGEISASHAPGGGAEFAVRLPL
ncbi:sensor histidine kinase [Agromyces bauzanensis]|uniref:histidine kinase n=1 Tax=Agromyces bauzanensis TaxID=1308924 RepID=A0A917PS79_9MICO|nr:HAMP domain-containing sensor histidine kinase [Agromyces bauzanensis]GGJ89121.1 two-component sensor histidine kinase [Agromyces bauzanensis]